MSGNVWHVKREATAGPSQVKPRGKRAVKALGRHHGRESDVASGPGLPWLTMCNPLCISFLSWRKDLLLSTYQRIWKLITASLLLSKGSHPRAYIIFENSVCLIFSLRAGLVLSIINFKKKKKTHQGNWHWQFSQINILYFELIQLQIE